MVLGEPLAFVFFKDTTKKAFGNPKSLFVMPDKFMIFKHFTFSLNQNFKIIFMTILVLP